MTTGGAASRTKSGDQDPKTSQSDHADHPNHADGSGRNNRCGNAANRYPTDNTTDRDDTDDTDNTTDPDDPDDTHGTDEWDLFTEPLSSNTKRFGRPEFTVVIDTTDLDPDGLPTVDWGIPITIPWQRIQDLSTNATIRPVIVRNGAVIDADGELYLGRTTRLANRAQRRALRAIYATCAVPGCNVSYNHTQPHHVHWWRHGGPTDLANLLPLCSQHHHAAHEGGWLLTLGRNRQLSIELPGGQVMRTGPPGRRSAAA